MLCLSFVLFFNQSGRLLDIVIIFYCSIPIVIFSWADIHTFIHFHPWLTFLFQLVFHLCFSASFHRFEYSSVLCVRQWTLHVRASSCVRYYWKFTLFWYICFQCFSLFLWLTTIQYVDVRGMWHQLKARYFYNVGSVIAVKHINDNFQKEWVEHLLFSNVNAKVVRTCHRKWTLWDQDVYLYDWMTKICTFHCLIPFCGAFIVLFMDVCDIVLCIGLIPPGISPHLKVWLYRK